MSETERYRQLLRHRGGAYWAFLAITDDHGPRRHDLDTRRAAARGTAVVPQTLDRAFGPAVDPWAGAPL